MKKIVSVILIVLVSVMISFGQATQSINYQAVARDTSGAILTNQDINVRITILKDSISGSEVYQETHSVEVNSYGLINLAIGTGTVISGTFSQIGWDTSELYLKVEIDPDAGNSYFNFGTTQLISVPYALESKHSSSLTLTGENGNKYVIKVDSSGNVVSEEIIEWLCGDSLVDTRDGKVYSTVLIGTQCWMAENLNIGVRKNGNTILTDDDVIEKYCYNDTEVSCDIYGGLYLWAEAMQYNIYDEGGQGICPNGWHFPGDAEWTTMTTYLGGESVAGGKMKEEGTTHWTSPNTGATNESGFTALPGGSRFYLGFFTEIGNLGSWWTSHSAAYRRYILFSDPGIFRDTDNNVVGYSVRCILDN
jgi:uncharacterized protein (TIGR02145 family)